MNTFLDNYVAWFYLRDEITQRWFRIAYIYFEQLFFVINHSFIIFLRYWFRISRLLHVYETYSSIQPTTSIKLRAGARKITIETSYHPELDGSYIRAPDFLPNSLPLPRLGLQLRAAAATLSPLATGNAGPDVKYDARSNFNYAMQQPWIVATGSFRHIGLIHVIRATLIKPGNAVSLNPPVECKMSLAR